MHRTDIHNLVCQSPPDFGCHELERFQLSDYLDFPTRYIAPEEGLVDLAKVCGTDHCDYYGSTWLELLPSNPDDYEHLEYWSRLAHEGKMKRGWNCIKELRNNPNYYIDRSPKEHWSFAKVGENYFVTQGNHRTVVGRFFLSLNNLPTLVHGVSITEIQIPQKPLSSLRSSMLINMASRLLGKK